MDKLCIEDTVARDHGIVAGNMQRQVSCGPWYAEIMSTPAVETFAEKQRAQAEAARLRLSNFADRAAQILEELAEYSENDRIRLSAADSILNRAGVVAPTEVRVTASPEEHQLVRGEAEETLKRIQENMQAQKDRKALSIEAIVLHEGDDQDTSVSAST